MIDRVTINRRDMLQVGSSMLAATAMYATPVAAQTQMTASEKKSEKHISPSITLPNEPHESASRGRRVS